MLKQKLLGFFIYLVQTYYTQMEMTENSVRSKVKTMSSVVKIWSIYGSCGQRRIRRERRI